MEPWFRIGIGWLLDLVIHPTRVLWICQTMSAWYGWLLKSHLGFKQPILELLQVACHISWVLLFLVFASLHYWWYGQSHLHIARIVPAVTSDCLSLVWNSAVSSFWEIQLLRNYMLQARVHLNLHGMLVALIGLISFDLTTLMKGVLAPIDTLASWISWDHWSLEAEVVSI